MRTLEENLEVKVIVNAQIPFSEVRVKMEEIYKDYWIEDFSCGKSPIQRLKVDEMNSIMWTFNFQRKV